LSATVLHGSQNRMHPFRVRVDKLPALRCKSTDLTGSGDLGS
jgi:hypothetical protein